MRTKLIRAEQEMVNYVCSTLCDCGRSYIGETSSTSAARLEGTQVEFRSPGEILD